MIEYHEVTRNELVEFQQAAYENGDDKCVRVAAECIRLMGLARMWNERAKQAESETEELALDLTIRLQGYIKKRS